jgi:carbon monoxide dehydrogenase subunit G
MARFTVSVDVAAPVEQVWDRITDWPVHGRWIPGTSVSVTSGQPGGVGATFVGRTALGPVGFDDPMEITQWSPPSADRPGHCRVRKLGRVLLGWAEFDVLARSGGSTVYWVEDVQVAPAWLTWPASPLIAAVGRVGFTYALGKMAAELKGEVSAGG